MWSRIGSSKGELARLVASINDYVHIAEVKVRMMKIGDSGVFSRRFQTRENVGDR